MLAHIMSSMIPTAPLYRQAQDNNDQGNDNLLDQNT
jgi:hypothetical protein